MLRTCFFLLINLNEALMDLKKLFFLCCNSLPQSGCDIAVAGPKGMGIKTLSLAIHILQGSYGHCCLAESGPKLFRHSKA